MALPLGLLAAAGLALALPLLMGLFRRRRSLAGLHVAVTGGSKGIGLGLAEEFVRRGAHVTIIARNQADLDAARGQLAGVAEAAGRAGGCKLQALSADTTSPEQVRPLKRRQGACAAAA